MTATTVIESAATDGQANAEPFAAEQGDLALLGHPVARRLLAAPIPARLAYQALAGAPRVVPLLFHWTGEELVASSWPDDPKVAAMRANPRVAVTIDTEAPPFRALSIRGEAAVTVDAGLPPESLLAFERYLGPEEGRIQAEQMGRMADRMARIAIRPTWVGLLDFETRFPRGMARRMGLAGA